MSNKQKLGYMAIGAGGPVVEASYEIAEYYEATTGYIPANDFGEPTMQIWTIRFDKPPQVLRVRNAVEYTLLDTETAYSRPLLRSYNCFVGWRKKRFLAAPFIRRIVLLLPLSHITTLTTSLGEKIPS